MHVCKCGCVLCVDTSLYVRMHVCICAHACVCICWTENACVRMYVYVVECNWFVLRQCSKYVPLSTLYPDALCLHNLTAGRIPEFLKASAQQSAEIRVNLDPRRTSHSGLRSQFISDLVRHWKWVYASGFCDGAYKVDMRQSCEIANIVLATALLPKPI